MSVQGSAPGAGATCAAVFRDLLACGDRATGRPGADHCRRVLSDWALRYDCRVERQTFSCPDPGPSAACLSWPGGELVAERAGFTGHGTSTIEAPLAAIDQQSAVRGLIAVCTWPRWRHRLLLIRAVTQAGAAGLILIGRRPVATRGIGAPPRDPLPMPVVCVPSSARTCLQALRGRSLRLSWSGESGTTTGCNLIVDQEGCRPDPRLLVMAHTDAWGTGASDNAAGVAAAMTLIVHARRWRLPPLRCLFTDAEEWGMLGSAAHFAQPHPPYRACLNLDMPVRQRHRPWRLLATDAHWRRRLPWWRALAAGWVPVPLDPLAARPGLVLPADVHHALRAGIPSLATWCPNRRQHADDTPDGIELRELLALPSRLAAWCACWRNA